MAVRRRVGRTRGETGLGGNIPHGLLLITVTDDYAWLGFLGFVTSQPRQPEPPATPTSINATLHDPVATPYTKCGRPWLGLGLLDEHVIALQAILFICNHI